MSSLCNQKTPAPLPWAMWRREPVDLLQSASCFGLLPLHMLLTHLTFFWQVISATQQILQIHCVEAKQCASRQRCSACGRSA